ncbi:MAG: FAD-dependent oxidoreductase [Planctomycetota bacterium]
MQSSNGSRTHSSFMVIAGTLLLMLSLLTMGCVSSHARRFDVVVYGGTAGGTIAAIAAAEEGSSVALLEPGRHIGGMVSGGLGRTDFGNKTVIGGLSGEFFIRLGKHYGKPMVWHFEPHVAENIFNNWLNDAGVQVFLGHRLKRVAKRGNRIISIHTETGSVFSGKVFIDCSYEGDLMAGAGVSYTCGREGQDVYGESLAGVREYSKYHQFGVPVSGYDEDGKLLPCVYDGDRGNAGRGDKKIQAYNFRICLSNRKENQVPFPRPVNYDSGRYEILRRYLAKRGKDLKLNDIMIVSMMPNGKTDINNRGPFSTDHIGANWDYPEADYQRRREIWEDHVSYVQGFFYFLANDPSVPRHLQDEINRFGLAKDEFVDTGHWPHQMYVREARRMIGDYVMTQQDLQTDRTKPDSIGMGSYNIDSHHVQRVVKNDGTLENEGDMQVRIQPYEIAYRSLTPKRHECGNLVVPVCVSASHVAYSSIRMEPQYMIMGHAAGKAAAYAVNYRVPVQNVDIAWLQKRLRDQGQVLCMQEALQPYVALKSLGGIVVDNCAAITIGSWKSSTAIGPFAGADYLHDDNEGKGHKRVRFVPDLPADGEYEVLIAYTYSPNRATNVSVSINTADGLRKVILNQRKRFTSPPFTSIGRFRFTAGKNGYVEITNTNTNGYVVADAVQWLPGSLSKMAF